MSRKNTELWRRAVVEDDAAPADPNRLSVFVEQGCHAVEHTLDAIAVPVWIVRDDAHIEFANTAAQSAMAETQWITHAGGRLVGIGQINSVNLHLTLREVRADNPSQRMSLVVAFNRQGKRQRGALHIVPISQNALYLYAATWPRACAILSLELPPQINDPSWLALITRDCKLTKAQRQVLEDLVRGQTVEEIAAVRGIKVGTVRAHLNAIYTKTGHRRQADLIRLALGV